MLPIGVFPGGYDNMTLKQLVPNVFGQTEDVRRYCESAMALIEDVRRPIMAFQYQKVSPLIPFKFLGRFRREPDLWNW